MDMEYFERELNRVVSGFPPSLLDNVQKLVSENIPAIKEQFPAIMSLMPHIRAAAAEAISETLDKEEMAAVLGRVFCVKVEL
jgi:hypothetical protein